MYQQFALKQSFECNEFEWAKKEKQKDTLNGMIDVLILLFWISSRQMIVAITASQNMATIYNLL